MSYNAIAFDQTINEDAYDELSNVALHLRGSVGHCFSADNFVQLVSKASSIDLVKRFEFSLGRVLLPPEEVRAILFDLTQLSEDEAEDFMEDCGVTEHEWNILVSYLGTCADNDLVMEWYDDTNV